MKLTIKPFWAEWTHDIGHRVVEKRCSHGIAHGKLPCRFHKKATVLKGSHRIGPGFTARVYEAGVDPAGNFVYLQPHEIIAIFSLFLWTAVFFIHSVLLPIHTHVIPLKTTNTSDLRYETARRIQVLFSLQQLYCKMSSTKCTFRSYLYSRLTIKNMV